MPIRDPSRQRRQQGVAHLDSPGWSPWQGSSFSPGSGAGGSLLGASDDPGRSEAVPSGPPLRASSQSLGSISAFSFAESARSASRLRSNSSHAGFGAHDDPQLQTRQSAVGGLRSASAQLPTRPWPLMRRGAPTAELGFGGRQPPEDCNDEELHDVLCCPITQVRRQ